MLNCLEVTAVVACFFLSLKFVRVGSVITERILIVKYSYMFLIPFDNYLSSFLSDSLDAKHREEFFC